MSTTTIRLPEELKGRVTAAAERAGSTPHAFILEAIAEKTAREERRDGFMREAEARYALVVASGEAIPWQEMRQYLMASTTNDPSPLPAPRKLAR